MKELCSVYDLDHVNIWCDHGKDHEIYRREYLTTFTYFLPPSAGTPKFFTAPPESRNDIRNRFSFRTEEGGVWHEARYPGKKEKPNGAKSATILDRNGKPMRGVRVNSRQVLRGNSVVGFLDRDVENMRAVFELTCPICRSRLEVRENRLGEILELIRHAGGSEISLEGLRRAIMNTSA